MKYHTKFAAPNLNILFFWLFCSITIQSFSQPYRLPVDYQEAERFVKKKLKANNHDFIDGFTYYFYNNFDYFWFLSKQDTNYCVIVIMPAELEIFSMDCGTKDVYYDSFFTMKRKRGRNWRE